MLKKIDLAVAYGLLIAGALQLILLFVVFFGYSGDIFTRLIYNAFSISALYLPALYFLGAYLIIKKPFNKSVFQYSVASIVIFFPVSTLIKILVSDNTDPIIDYLHTTFDRPGHNTGSIFLLVGIILIFFLASRIVIKYLNQHNRELSSIENSEENNIIDHSDRISVEESNNPFGVSEEFHIDDNLEESIEKEDIKENSENMLVIEDEDVEVSSSKIDEDDEDLISSQIDQIKNEINEYYIKEDSIEKVVSNIPFSEPMFPETTEIVDIDELDNSNNLLNKIVQTELTKR